MKIRVLLSILAMTAASLTHAETVKHPGCAVVLDAPVKSITVEQGHIIDVCLSDPTQQVERIVLGQPQDWRFDVGSSKDIIYFTPLESHGGTNALIYLKGEPEARYELRLRSKTMLSH